jgi:hypothetical protein
MPRRAIPPFITMGENLWVTNDEDKGMETQE